jgi:hypothetical protein
MVCIPQVVKFPGRAATEEFLMLEMVAVMSGGEPVF